MRTRFACLITIASALGVSAWAQGPAPRMPDGKPDLNGLLNGGLSSQDISLNLIAGVSKSSSCPPPRNFP